jgi:hypothetical protein
MNTMFIKYRSILFIVIHQLCDTHCDKCLIDVWFSTRLSHHDTWKPGRRALGKLWPLLYVLQDRHPTDGETWYNGKTCCKMLQKFLQREVFLCFSKMISDFLQILQKLRSVQSFSNSRCTRAFQEALPSAEAPRAKHGKNFSQLSKRFSLLRVLRSTSDKRYKDGQRCTKLYKEEHLTVS